MPAHNLSGGAESEFGRFPTCLLEIIEHLGELWELQSSFFLPVFEFAEGSTQLNSRPISFVSLAHDVIKFRDRTICVLRKLARMTSGYDVLRIRASLKYGSAHLTGAIRPRAEGAAQHHILRDIDGNQPIWSIKDFIVNESASGEAQKAYNACAPKNDRDHASLLPL
jgi:hypothetical protein